jgi:ATP:cob(I)alamin adenosyltransferase
MNKYLAYCYLYEDAADLKCDFEILTDEISSMIGLLRSLLADTDKTANPELAENLCKVNELMYHINPSLRTEVMVTEEELEWLFQQTQSLQKKVEGVVPAGSGFRFVLPQGCTQAAYSHVIRNKCKTLVRLLSRYKQQGNEVEEILFDFCNLYSGYFYFLSLWLNKNHDEKERSFVSRVYCF